MSKCVTRPTKIKQIGRVVTGSTPPTRHSEYFGDEYLFIKPSDLVKDQRYICSTQTKLSRRGYDYLEKQVLPRNSVCVVCIGTLGKSCMTKGPSFTNQQINSIIVDESKYNPHFIFYLLKLNIPKVKLLDCGSASGRENVNKSSFESIELEIPELPIQERIARVLLVFDDLIEQNLERIKLLEEIVQMLYREWFVCFRFPGYDGIKMVPSKLGMIPDGWNVKRLGGVVDNIVLGGTPSRKRPRLWEDGTIPWMKSGKLNDVRVIEGSEMITSVGLSSSAAKLMPKRTVLIAITGAILVSLSEIELCANQSVVGIYGSKELIQEYIYLFEVENVNQLISKMSGSAQQHVNKEIVENSLILVPDLDVMEKFNEVAKPIFDLISNLLFKNKNLGKARDLLLPNLISGEIDISELNLMAIDHGILRR